MAIYDLLDPRLYVDKETYRKRLSLCNSCPERLEYAKGNELKKISRCPECGCICYLKAKLTTESCPFGDW